MLFNSIHYLFFLPIAVFAHYLFPHRHRWAVLLVLSCYFYMAFIPYYILILFVLILVDYTAGIWIEGAHGSSRRLYLLLSLVANIGILGAFKYLDFFLRTLGAISPLLGHSYTAPQFHLALPIGLSFHTFQSLSYTLEVYFGRFRAERHLGIYALYVLFFPQMVAGPIERPQHVFPQLHREREFDYGLAVEGLRLIFVGLVKKVLIADNLATLVDQVYKNPFPYAGPALSIATLAFAFQIYCDFSGYSDIARGSAKLLGIDLVVNFSRPYFAASVSEFWHRWHISLSTWFRDYVYIPLGGNRGSTYQHTRNVLVTFVLSGLWHGANWTYVVWGGLHGAFVVLEKHVSRLSGRGTEARSWIPFAGRTLALLAVVYAWVFFRAHSMSDAIWVSQNLFRGWNRVGAGNLFGLASRPRLFFYLALVAGLLSAERAAERGLLLSWFSILPRPLRWGVYYVGFFALALLGSAGGKQFIYFQF